MKNKRLLVLTLILVLVFSLALVACEKSDKTPDEVEITFGEWEVVKLPTDSEVGSIKRKGSDDKEYTFELPKLGDATYIVDELKKPSCENEGEVKYTITAVDKTFSFTIKTPAIGHDYSVEYAWSDDLSVCTALHKCANDQAHNELATATITKEVVAPTFEADGYTKYTAIFEEDWAEAQEKIVAGDAMYTLTKVEGKAATCTETGLKEYWAGSNGVNYEDEAHTKVIDDLNTWRVIESLGHDWNIKYVWTDTTACMAIRVCANDSAHMETASATITTEITPATCIAKGKTSYIATFDKDWAETQTKEFENIDMVDHSYVPNHDENNHWQECSVCHEKKDIMAHSFGEWVIDEDSTCSKVGSKHRDCACGYTETVEIEKKPHTYESVVTLPTCTARGYTTHTCSVCGDSYVDTYVDALGHDFTATTYEWAEDGSSCIAKRTCQREGCNTVESAIGTITSEVIIEATCTDKGTTKYTATFTEAWANDSTKEIKDIDAKGHRWSVKYTWNNDFTECKATHICANDGAHNETVVGVIKTDIIEATCTTPGRKTVTATFDRVWAEGQIENIIIDVIPHSYESKHDANNHWQECSVCHEKKDVTAHSFGEWVIDEDSTCTKVGSKHRDCACGYTETVETEMKAHTYESVVTLPTCTKRGYTTHTCSVCGDSYIDTYVDALGHDFTATTYEWAEDGSSCTAKRTCQREGCNTVESATGTITSEVTTAATCGAKGITTYTATFTEEWAKSETAITKEIENIDMLPHSFGATTYAWSADYSTCTATRKCTECSHSESETVDTNISIYKQPTCTEKGATAYIANFKASWAEEYSDIKLNISALGHDWSVEYEWNGDMSACTAKRICANDANHNLTSNATITIDTNTPNVTKYTATFVDEWTSEQVVSMTHVDGTAATYGSSGYKAYYYKNDDNSDRYVKDEAGTYTAASEADLLIEELVGNVTVYVNGTQNKVITHKKSENVTIADIEKCLGAKDYVSYNMYKDNGKAEVLTDITAHAKENQDVNVYVYKVYTLTFDANGGELTGDGTSTLEYGKPIVLPSVSNGALVLDGWYDVDTFIKEDSVVTRRATIKANWYINGLAFTLNADGSTYNVSGYTGSEQSINLPKKFKGFDVVGIGTRAFYDSSITDINIHENINSIGEEAFGRSYLMSRIYIPSTVQYMSNNVFAHCNILILAEDMGKKQAWYPEWNYTAVANYAPVIWGVTSIGKTEDYEYCMSANSGPVVLSYFGTGSTLTFPSEIEGQPLTKIIKLIDSNISGYTSIVIPATVTEMDDNIFASCTNVTSIVLPYCPGNIGYMFKGTTYGVPNVNEMVPATLNRVEILGGTRIGAHAFDGCTNISYISLPESIAEIGEYAFNGCSKLVSAYISRNVATIGRYAFDGCSKITIYRGIGCYEVNWDKEWYGHYYMYSVDDVVGSGYTDDYAYAVMGDQTLTISRYTGNTVDLTIPKTIDGKTVTTLYVEAFKYSPIESVVIPNTIKIIDKKAFSECVALRSITFEENSALTAINMYAFNKCKNLQSIVLPNGLTEIGTLAFANCANLSSIVIPNTVTKIGESAFWKCTKLTNVTIPDSVTEMGATVFKDTNNVKIYTTVPSRPAGWDPTWNADKPVAYGYDGLEHTYTFNTNGGLDIAPITSNDIIGLPTPTKGGWYFGGWYENPEFNGDSYLTHYYNKNNVTLYAKWLTESEYKDGRSFERAKTINLNVAETVNIVTPEQMVYYKFVAPETRSYTINRNNYIANDDTKCYIYNSNKQELIYQDDELFTYDLVAGQTYYIAVRWYFSNATGGSFDLTIS